MNKKNKTKTPLYLLTVAIVACTVLAGLLSKRNISGKIKEDANTSTNTSKTVTIDQGENLTIQKSDITENASFYPVTVDDVSMELIAIRDSEGNVRTAFNTCQVCYGSGRAYYVQQGDFLICQNCGNRFTSSHVEVESGGCNPWPIFSDNKTENDQEIIISYEFLKESQMVFDNWKVFK